MEKIKGELPTFNDKIWPQENLNNLKNIRSAKVPLKSLVETRVTLFSLWNEMLQILLIINSNMLSKKHVTVTNSR